MKIKGRPSPGEIQQALQSALEHGRAGEWPKAVRLLRDVAAYEPDHFDVAHLLGAALVQTGRLEEGVERLQHAARLRPSALAVWVNLGLAHQAAKQPEQALQAFAQGSSRHPMDSEPARRRTLLLADLGRLDEAMKSARAFTERNPASDVGWATRGVVESMQDVAEEAETSFGKALEIANTNLLAIRGLGLLHARRGRHADAVPLLEQALARAPADAEVQSALDEARRHLAT